MRVKTEDVFILWLLNFFGVEMHIFSLKFDQFDPISSMSQKVCQNSAIQNEEKNKKIWLNQKI